MMCLHQRAALNSCQVRQNEQSGVTLVIPNQFMTVCNYTLGCRPNTVVCHTLLEDPAAAKQELKHHQKQPESKHAKKWVDV